MVSAKHPPVHKFTELQASRLLVGTLLALTALLAWDASGLDLELARLAGDRNGFALRDHVLLTTWMHDGVRRLSWVLAVVLCLSVWWPIGPLARLHGSRRLQFAVTALVAPFMISALKAFSSTSCPWDLDLFGGMAHYASHWSLAHDGGAGHCFPAGHASAGFAFFGGFFAYRRSEPRTAATWLLVALGAGLLLGLVQQARGAHFMSHTLWSAWISWAVAYLIDRLWRPVAARWKD